MAFLVEGEGQSLLYSGDIRTHGRKPWLTKNLVTEVAQRRIDVLLMEGTHLGGDSLTGITEPDLEETIVPLVQEASGVVLAAFSPMDVDRLVTFYKAARRADRTFVVDVYAAFVLYLVASQANTPPPVAEKGIRVYYHQAFVSTYVKRRMESIAEKFTADRIPLEEVLADPSRYVMSFRPSMVELDFGGRLPHKARCVYSYWKGYLKNPDWVEFQERIKAAGGDFLHAHTSGHIFINDLIDLVKAINPRTIVPVHTFEPQEFRRYFTNVRLLQDGEVFVVE
jgi:ribonuclease J